MVNSHRHGTEERTTQAAVAVMNEERERGVLLTRVDKDGE